MDKKHVKNHTKTGGGHETGNLEDRRTETETETETCKKKTKKISSGHERGQKEGSEKDISSEWCYPSRVTPWDGQKIKKVKKVVKGQSCTNEPLVRKGTCIKGSKGSTKLHVPVAKLQKNTPVSSSSIRNLRERLQKIVKALSLIEEKCIGEKPQQRKRKNREEEGRPHSIKVPKKKCVNPPASPSSSLSSFHSSVGGDHGRGSDTWGGGGGDGGGRSSSPPLRNAADGIDEFLNSQQKPKNYYYDILTGTGGGENVDVDVFMGGGGGGGCMDQSVEKALPEFSASDLYSDFDDSYTSESFGSVCGLGLKK